MAANTDNMCVTLIGNSLISKSPLFSLDSEYLFVVSGRNVLVYSTSSGECVRKLKAQNEIISIFVNPKNQLQLGICANRRELKKDICDVVFWDYVDGIRHKTYEITHDVEGLWMPNADGIIYFLSKGKLIQRDNLFNQNAKREKKIFVGVENYNQIAIGLRGEYLVKINNNAVFVNFPKIGLSTKNQLYTTKNRYTCVATHPSEYCIATGNSVGKVILWYNIDTDNFVKSSLHWHQLPVASICFVGSGNEILSAGGECVLVKWRVNVDVPQFVPRLGMPICDVVSSLDGDLIATCHVDNSIHLVNNHNKIVKVIQGLTQGHHWKELNWDPNPIGLIYDPVTSSLVLNGKPGHVQFYSLKEDKQLFNLDITYQNYRHKERNFKVFFTEVWRAAYDVSGTWLATVEFRDDTETELEIKLKFWKFRRDIQNYELNTTVELPHSLRVNALKFAPRAEYQVPLCVTTSNDKRFKTWTLSEGEDDGSEKKSSWNCDSVGYYREVESGAAGFSDDGTTMGIVFNHAITLWNPETNALKGTLYDPKSKLKVEQIEFASEQYPELLISVTRDNIVTWNLVTSTVEARMSINECLVVRDPLSQLMVAFDNESNLVVFTPEKLEVLRSKKLFDGIKRKKIICSIFVPSDRRDDVEWELKSQLYFMDEDLNLYKLTTTTAQREENEVVKTTNNLPFTPMGVILNQHLKLQETSRKTNRVENEDVIGDLFSASANMIPPPRLQCALLHEQLLRKRHKNDDDLARTKQTSRIREESFTEKVNKTKEDENEDVRKEKQILTDISQFDWLSKLFNKM